MKGRAKKSLKKDKGQKRRPVKTTDAKRFAPLKKRENEE